MAKENFPPGPERNVLFTARNELRYNVLGIIQQNLLRYPGISRLKVGPYHFVILSEPPLIEEIFTNGDKFRKGRENANLRFLLGYGLLTSEGTFWLKQRRLIQPLFHKKRLDGFVQQIVDLSREMKTAWEKKDGQTFDVHGEMTGLTLAVVSQTLLSTTVGGDFKKINDALALLMRGLSQRTLNFLSMPYWVPSPQNIRMKKNRHLLDETIFGIINQRRSDKKQYDDLLSMLMEVEDADTAERMTNQQLRDEALTIFLAGHETTANALSFAFYLLAKHPEARERIAAEAETVLGENAITYESLNKLDYTTRVIKESMRLYPPAWIITREAVQDTELGGYFIKKGDTMLASPYAVQRSATLWQEPEKFDPDRFLPARMANMHRYAYFPFGGGNRLCIGNNFAMMEMQIILAVLAPAFKFSLPDDFKLDVEALVTLRPRKELYLILERNKEQSMV